ncbi:hypothetical protein ACLBOM_08485 [Escherichia coli]
MGGGRREEEARLKAKIDYLGMNDCVLMCGLLSPVAPVYRRASLMVMPSGMKHLACLNGSSCTVDARWKHQCRVVKMEN